jgi:hypothetical protein
LTACSFGKATGTVGVEVVVGGGVFEGTAVSVGVAGAGVTEAVISDRVGVAVGALEGRLQADRTGIRTSTYSKVRNFIALSF